MFRRFLLVAIFFTGCADIKEFLHKDRARESATAPEKSTQGEPEAPKSPIIESGTGYERLSGTDYNWLRRENGFIEILWVDSGRYNRIGIAQDGTMFTELAHEIWEYNSWSDSCSNGRDSRKGLRCIHPVVRDFFEIHRYKPEHPMFERIK